MTERWAILPGHAVRAILDGRKSMHRIPLNLSNKQSLVIDSQSREDYLKMPAVLRFCPYGVPGDLVWIKETWAELLHTSPATGQPNVCDGDKLIEPATQWTDAKGVKHWHYDGKVIAYRATSAVEFCDGDGFIGENADKADMPKWKSAVHMPRWASRLSLLVTSVRVERLQEITEEDAILEGSQCAGVPAFITNRGAFAKLWNLTNSERGFGWHTDPWVYVISFKRNA